MKTNVRTDGCHLTVPRMKEEKKNASSGFSRIEVIFGKDARTTSHGNNYETDPIRVTKLCQKKNERNKSH